MRNPTSSIVATFMISSLVLTSTTRARAQVVVQQPVPVYGPGYVAPGYPQPQAVYAPAPRLGPRVIKNWQEGDPIPVGYHRAERPRLGLVIGGAVLFGTMYFISALAAAICATPDIACGGSTTHEDLLYIPGVGPFLQMTQASTAVGDVFLAIDGLAQLGGIAMFTYGLASPKTVLARDDLGDAPLPRFAITPMIGAGRGGMGVVARF